MIQKRFDIIFITLGFDCNFNCKYCLQDEGYCQSRVPEKSPGLSQKLLNFLDNYNHENVRIRFWGGEPLLYLDSIKQIVKRYGEKFKYGMVTNGSLLTEDIINYFEKNNITFAVSHDGEATEYTRNTDVLKNKKIKNLLLNTSSFTNFSSVYSAANSNHRKLFEFFQEQGFGDKNLQVDMMYNTGDAKKQIELANIDEEKYAESLKEMFLTYKENVEKPASPEKEREWEQVYWMIERLGKRLSGKDEQYENVRVQCRACKTVLNLDYDGNVYICHNSTYKLGTVDSTDEEIFEQYKKYLREKYTPKCKTCEIYEYCPGACLLLTEKGQEQYCKLRKIKVKLLLDFLMGMKNILAKENEE